MKSVRTFWLKLRSLLQRREVNREIDEELRFHIEQRTGETTAAGMSTEEVAREARKRFGNLPSVREACRERKGTGFGEGVWQDVRFGLRMLRKNPGFAAITVLTLALGVAGNIVIFTAYNSLYLRPFPFVEPDRLVDLNERAPRWNLEYTGLSWPEFSNSPFANC
jgi:hypothetical protein